jgi:hypothetical protein
MVAGRCLRLRAERFRPRGLWKRVLRGAFALPELLRAVCGFG